MDAKIIRFRRKRLIENYSNNYNIPKDVLDDICKTYDSVEDLNALSLALESYIVAHLDEYASCIEANNLGIKEFYKTDKETHESLNRLDDIYKNAIQMLSRCYNYNESLEKNIKTNMKYIIVRRNYEIYNLSFLSNLNSETKDKIFQIFGSNDVLYEGILKGARKATEKELSEILSIFNLSSYGELKKLILKEESYNKNEEIIKENKRGGKKVHPIYERSELYGYDKDTINEAIIMFSGDEDKLLLKRAYGEDLDNPQRDLNWSKEDGQKLSNLIAKIATKCKEINKDKKIIEKDKKENKRRGKKVQLIYERPMLNAYDKDTINDAIDMLSDADKLLLKRAYGEDLDNPQRDLNWEKEDNAKLSYLIAKIEAKCKETINGSKDVSEEKPQIKRKGKKPKLIYQRAELEDYDKDTINDVINMLSDEEKKLVKKAYGDDLNNPERDSSWTTKDGILLSNLLDKIAMKCKNNNKNEKITEDKKETNDENKRRGKKVQPIYERSLLYGYDKDTINEAISMFSGDEDKLLLKRAYGENLDNPQRDLNWEKEDNVKLSYLIGKIATKCKEIINENNEVTKEENEVSKEYIAEIIPTIFEEEQLSKYDIELKEQVISKLLKKDKQFLSFAYGTDDLYNPIKSPYRNDDDNWGYTARNHFYYIISKIARLCEEKQNNKDKENVPVKIKEIQDSSLPTTKNIENKEDLLLFTELLSMNVSLDYLSTLPEGERKVINMIFQNKYSLTDISEILGIEPNYVIKIYESMLDMFEKIIKDAISSKKQTANKVIANIMPDGNE